MRARNIGVFAVVVHAGLVLLVRRNYDDRAWALPGGAVEPEEGTLAALRREVREETGQELAHAEFVGAFYSRRNYSMALLHRATLARCSPIVFDPRELEAVEFFPLGGLPDGLSLRHEQWLRFCLGTAARPSNLLELD